MFRAVIFCILTGCSFSVGFSQEEATASPGSADSAAAIPSLVKFDGSLTGWKGGTAGDEIEITFQLYAEPQGGEPLWAETQTARPDKDGKYSVVLGSTTSEGLPRGLFASGEARWLGVQPAGMDEQPRVLLVAVPYALKSADAETLGGLPASAFQRAGASGAARDAKAEPAAKPESTNPAITGKGSPGFLALWNSEYGIADSAIFERSGNLGIATNKPADPLDVNGKADFRDTLTLFPRHNDSALAVSGTKFKIDATGKITFVAGQTFPSPDAITGVSTSATSGLQGGGVSGALNLSVKPSGITNSMLQSPSFNLPVTAPLTGGGKISLGGTAAALALAPCPANQGLLSNGASWSCSAAGTGGSGGISNIVLSAPSADFTVFGSPLTSNGTLGFAWNNPPTNVNQSNTIVKRDSSGDFQTHNINMSNLSAYSITAYGASYFLSSIFGIGTSKPATSVNINQADAASYDTFLVGGKARGVQISDTNSNVEIASLGGPLCVNCTGSNPTYIGGPADFFGGNIGVGTATPQAVVNLNVNGTAKGDSLLLGNNTTKGLQLRDTGTGADLESIGVPLYVNYLTQQPLYLNPNGGIVYVGGATQNAEKCTFTGSYFCVPGALLNVGSAGDGAGNYTSAYFTDDILVGGNALVLGDLTVEGSKQFHIDHPLDPENKYLNHAAIESSEVLNQYSGNVVLDGNGEASVEFPDWFAAINVDFRYLLTAVGAPGPNLYVAKEIEGNSFTIAGGTPGMKVSWQVTARRNDPYMKAHPMVVEADKPEALRGRYLAPELYGAPRDKAIFPQTSKAAKNP